MESKKIKILAVDDDKDNLLNLGFLINKIFPDVSFITALSGEKGLELAASEDPDVLLLDILMPGMDGFEVCKKLKADKELNIIPVIFITALKGDKKSRIRALESGAEAFLAKPIDQYELTAQIRAMVKIKNSGIEKLRENERLAALVEEKTHELKETQEAIIKLNESLEQRVFERTAQLEAANKELESFSYSVSHDLRAPLRHINGFITLLKEVQISHLTKEELRYMDMIASGAEEMGKLIDALLSFSRINRIELHKSTINTSEMVQSVIRFFKSETKDRKITFKVGQIPDCEGDEQLIKQVWMNLISNAIKYTGHKTEAYIIIGSIKHDRETVYYVKDNGAGFDMKHAERLFGVFQRLHKTRDFEGIGIGLANVNSIISRHNGLCRAEGEVGEGATFYFSLPD